MNHKALFAYNWTKRWGDTADGDWLRINIWLFLILSFFSPSLVPDVLSGGCWGGDGGRAAVMSCHNLIFLPPISTLCTNLHILRRRKILFLTVSLVRSQYRRNKTEIFQQYCFEKILSLMACCTHRKLSSFYLILPIHEDRIFFDCCICVAVLTRWGMGPSILHITIKLYMCSNV